MHDLRNYDSESKIYINSKTPTTPLELVQEVDTRWDSTFSMFHWLLQLRVALDIVLCHDSKARKSQFRRVEFLRVIDKSTPTKKAIEIMSGDLYPTISQCYPIYFRLTSVIRTHIKESGNVSDIASSLCNALQVTFIIYVNRKLRKNSNNCIK